MPDSDIPTVRPAMIPPHAREHALVALPVPPFGHKTLSCGYPARFFFADVRNISEFLLSDLHVTCPYCGDVFRWRGL